MSKKTAILFVALFSFGAVLTALAQNQTPVTPAEISPTSASIDNQGIRRYLLGPGDILDVRVFGQPDLNSTVEIDEDGNISQQTARIRIWRGKDAKAGRDEPALAPSRVIGYRRWHHTGR